MSKEITILIGDEECTAELLTEQAPRTCEIIENALPLTGMATHAKLVDREVFFPVPFFVDAQENLKISEKGDLAFWNARRPCAYSTTMWSLWEQRLPSVGSLAI